MAHSRYPDWIVHTIATFPLMARRTVPAMADNAIAQSRARLEERLAELAPALDEAAKIKAALEALNGGPRRPVTALDTLKPVPPPPADEA
jgi:hypothetical protein